MGSFMWLSSSMKLFQRIVKLECDAYGYGLTPPKDMVISIGGGNFKEVGEEFFRYFVEFGDLKPDEKVLDVGCGVGRMAVPLINHFTGEGCYEGFDIMPNCIDWCKENISSRNPKFHFRLANIYNKQYNPGGKYKALEYSFPYGDHAFDFTFLTSVFTHMLPQDMEKYLSEIARVLKPGGRCLITYFLLNNESLQLIGSNKSSLDFKHDLNGCLTINKDIPESAIAYNEEFIREIYDRHGLEIVRPILYGSWCGRENYLSYQDIIIANRI